ncbi:50S ribosomal protein L30, partial [Dysosmobacter welbionis]
MCAMAVNWSNVSRSSAVTGRPQSGQGSPVLTIRIRRSSLLSVFSWLAALSLYVVPQTRVSG